jgi:hypothetical protein
LTDNPGYLFRTTSANPCDRCDAMAGEHDIPPFVPVHPHCECEVDVLGPESTETGDARSDEPESDFREVRNVEVMESDYVNTFPKAEFSSAKQDRHGSMDIDLGIVDEDLDDPLSISDLPIDIPSGTDSKEVTLPARSSGTIWVAEKIVVYVVKAELWRVYTHRTDQAAFVEEEHVGDIGGFVKVRAEGDVIVDATPDDGGPDPRGHYFEDGDGVPS